METERSGATLAEVEREHILRTLARCGGNRTLTANVLGISVRGLRMKLHGYHQAGFEIAAPNQGHEVKTISSPIFPGAQPTRPVQSHCLNPVSRTQRSQQC